MLKTTTYILSISILIGLFTNCSREQKSGENLQNPIDTNLVYITPKNYLDFAYSKIIAFATVKSCDYSELYYEKSMDMSKFHDTISKSLNKKQIDYLNDILSGKYRKPYHKDSISIVSVADCFYPRHNIIFLGNRDSIVNFISICFECGNAKESKPDLAHMDDMKTFFDSIGLKVFDRPDEYEMFYDSINKYNKRKN